MVSVDVKHHVYLFLPFLSLGSLLSLSSALRAQELCESRDRGESRGRRPGFPVPNKPYASYGFCGRKATLN